MIPPTFSIDADGNGSHQSFSSTQAVPPPIGPSPVTILTSNTKWFVNRYRLLLSLNLNRIELPAHNVMLYVLICGFGDDDLRVIVLVQGLQPPAQVYVFADDGIA